MSSRSKRHSPKNRGGVSADINQARFDPRVQIPKTPGAVTGPEALRNLGALREALDQHRQHEEQKEQARAKAQQDAAKQGPSSAEAAMIRREYDEFFGDQMHLMATVCTGLWRAQQNLGQTSGQASDGSHRAMRHLNSVMDAIQQAGFEIKDHTREHYEPGMRLSVLTFEPTQGITRAHVIETIKPSIYYKGQPIQTGEVIVATPADKPTE